MPKIACIIPARLNSSRLPEKIIKPLCGKPLVQWAWQAAQKMNMFDTVIIALDHEKTVHAVQTFQGAYVMTADSCHSGTDRLIEVMQTQSINADIWVNWQGDEPFITKTMIEELLQTCADKTIDVWTLKKRITNPHDIENPNIAKVVCDHHGNALYFSRSPIPYYRNTDADRMYYKHVGLYAYTSKALKKIAKMPPSNLENAEKLEQLRFLQHNLTIRMHETQQEAMGIDTPQDLEKAQNIAKSM